MINEEEIPFNYLSRKWVKILQIAFKSAEDNGYIPEKFYIYPHYIVENQFSKDPVYQIHFHSHKVDWMNGGVEGGESFAVVLNSINFKFIQIFKGRD